MYRLVLILSAHPGKMQAVRGGVGEERKNFSPDEDLQTVVGARHARRDRVVPGQGIEQGEGGACHVQHEDRAGKVAGKRVSFV